MLFLAAHSNLINLPPHSTLEMSHKVPMYTEPRTGDLILSYIPMFSRAHIIECNENSFSLVCMYMYVCYTCSTPIHPNHVTSRSLYLQHAHTPSARLHHELGLCVVIA